MSTLEAIGRLVGDDLQKVRDVIGRCIECQPEEIREALGYYFSSGGKLLRPLLALLSAHAAVCGELPPAGARETVLFAAAVEFVHNASLVHDDIMDGELLRRNMATLHAKYGETCAVLLGDVLHITVFDLLAQIENRSAVALMASTIRDMCYGQLLDVRRAKRTAEEYEKIIRYKTGALMATACAGGVAMSGAAMTGRAVDDIGRFGMQAGMLYQMVDDYLDGDAGIALTPADIHRRADICKRYLKAFPRSLYRSRLSDLVDHFSGMVFKSDKPLRRVQRGDPAMAG